MFEAVDENGREYLFLERVVSSVRIKSCQVRVVTIIICDSPALVVNFRMVVKATVAVKLISGIGIVVGNYHEFSSPVSSFFDVNLFPFILIWRPCGLPPQHLPQRK